MQRAGLAPPGYGERTLAVVTLFLLAFGVPTVWFQADNTDVPTGDSIVIIVNSVLFALAFTRLVGSWRHVGRAIRREPFLLMFVAFMVFSTVWSTTPDATFRRSTAIFLTTFFGYYLVVRFPLREIIRLTALALMIGTVVQFVWVLVLRKYGVTQITGELAESGDWSGVYPHKNALGRGSLLAAVLFVFAARTFPRRRVLYWAFFALNTVLIVGSNSKTALVALVLLVVLMALFTGLRAHATLYGGVAFGLVGTAVLAAGFVTTNLGPISESLGKDATLTGRTQLWTDVIHEIGRRPWLGFGWLGFWTGDPTGPSGYVLARNLWHPPNAHNAVLELLINLGIIGAALFLVVYFRGLFRSVGQVRRVPTILGLFPLTYFSLVLLESITEIGVIGRDLTWALFVVAVVLAGRDRAEPGLGAPAARATATRPPRQARTATGRPVAAAVVDAPVLEDPALEDPALADPALDAFDDDPPVTVPESTPTEPSRVPSPSRARSSFSVRRPPT